MSEEKVLVLGWWARFMQFVGLKKPQIVEVKPDQYSTEKVLAMVNRVAAKSVHWELGDKHIGLVLYERLPVEGRGIVSADNVQFVKRWTESTEQDPLLILFLLDSPEWNNPYPITDFDSHLGWFFENALAQLQAFEIWKRTLLR
jgi:hypothetical protein